MPRQAAQGTESEHRAHPIARSIGCGTTGRMSCGEAAWGVLFRAWSAGENTAWPSGWDISKSWGPVKVVFSRRDGDGKVLALVTDDLKAPMRTVVADYLKRWAVELWIKAQKQNWDWAINAHPLKVVDLLPKHSII